MQSGGGAVDRCSAVGRPLQTERAKRGGFFGSGRSTVGLGAVDRWRRQRDWCSGERVFPCAVNWLDESLGVGGEVAWCDGGAVRKLNGCEDCGAKWG